MVCLHRRVTDESPVDNPYVKLTHEFNEGRLRALLASGQAVVLHRLAIMSKDGDWILREDTEALAQVLEILDAHGARYRYGAPLDVEWLTHGWSSHFEFREADLRLRCDFVTRPPRIAAEDLQAEWEAPVRREAPIVSLPVLADLKKTNREKDYAVIGEIARRIDDPGLQLLYSRSARDLIALAEKYPEALKEVAARRPVLSRVGHGREELEMLLDRERRTCMRANEARLARYLSAAKAWSASWPQLSRELAEHDLIEAHAIMVSHARELLPCAP
jgi:hypothetical protein